MRIIIAVDGEVGLYLAQELSKEDHSITMIVPTEELVKTVESHSDVMATVGDSTLVSVLKRANVKKADLLISGLHEERINILTAALGKKIGAIRTIARINTLEYLSDDNKKMFFRRKALTFPAEAGKERAGAEQDARPDRKRIRASSFPCRSDSPRPEDADPERERHVPGK
jgi:trk system potassium uptake protein TrkA